MSPVAIGRAEVLDDYAGGPLANCTLAVCDCPDWSVQPICTVSPGWSAIKAAVRSDGVVIVVPDKLVITSPAVRPASSAGSPVTTPATATPDSCALPWPKPLLLVDWTSTPKKDVKPTWMVAEP